MIFLAVQDLLDSSEATWLSRIKHYQVWLSRTLLDGSNVLEQVQE
jgi:hypothetical protein